MIAFEDAAISAAALLITGGLGLVIQQLSFIAKSLTRIEVRLGVGEKRFEEHGRHLDDLENRVRDLERKVP